MSDPLHFDALVHAFHTVLDHLPDTRRGKNTQYAVKDAALGAFAVFFTQSPSFLAHQQTLQQAKGRTNAQQLLALRRSPAITRSAPCSTPSRPLNSPRSLLPSSKR